MEETTGLSKQQKKSMETKEKIFKAAKRIDRKSTRLNSSHITRSRIPSYA